MNQAKLSWAIAKGALGLRSPIYVQWAVTKRCNLNCRMCNSNRSRQGELELDLDDVARLADVLTQMGIGVLILTGGEPFVRSDLVDVYRTFARRGIVPRLQTNGILADGDRLRQLVDLGLSEMTLSLDSLNEELQDDINGRRGTWRQTIEALARVSCILPREANLSGVNVVVSKRNVHEVPQVVKFIDAIGFYASVIPVHVSRHRDRSFIIRKSADDFHFDPDDSPAVDRLYETLMAMKRRGARIQNSLRFLRESPHFLKYGHTQWRCDSPRLFFSISPSGSFLPCVDIAYERPMLGDTFLRDWRNGEIAREIAPLVQKCPGCMYACWPEVTYACSDPMTFLGRGVQALRLRGDRRPELSARDLFHLAATVASQ